jgi:hypothetical protein
MVEGLIFVRLWSHLNNSYRRMDLQFFILFIWIKKNPRKDFFIPLKPREGFIWLATIA